MSKGIGQTDFQWSSEEAGLDVGKHLPEINAQHTLCGGSVTDSQGF